MDTHQQMSRARGAVPVVLGVAVLSALALTSRYSYLLFHSLAEIFSVIVASGIFVVFWNTRRFLENGSYVALATAYLFVGLTDLLHTLGYEGMKVFPNATPDLPTQLWIAARYLESGAILVAAVAAGRRMAPAWAVVTCAGITGLLWASIFGGVFPACYVAGQGLTSFKVGSEYVICALLVASAILLWQRRQHFKPTVLWQVLAALTITVAAELSFTLYTGTQDLPNKVGHLLKIISFWLIYRAIIEVGLRDPYALIFRELKESEQRIEAELEKARGKVVRQTRLATIGQIAASIAHDLRNPLHSLRIGIALLERRFVHPSDTETHRYLKMMQSEIATTDGIINNLMEMARSKPADKQLINLGAVARQALDDRCRESRLVGRLDLETEPYVVYADPVQLRQVFWNLVGNAVQALGNEGEITVSAAREGAQDVILVSDTGPGVPAELRDQLFEPLVSGRPRGTGLGLSICRQIVERHGSSIRLLDRHAPGAAFEIRLPAADAAATEQALPGASPIELS